MIFIRADSNIEIASGHIMRCIAIAKYAKRIGVGVIFLIADENPVPMLKDAKMDYIVLHSDWRDLMTDSECVVKILQSYIDPVLLVDTYSITKEYIEKLAPFCKTAYLGSKQEKLGALNVLINYSTDIDYKFYATNYNGTTKLLLGPSFAPLREEFQNVIRTTRRKVQRILVTTGNTDAQNIVGDIIKVLDPLLKKRKIILEVVVGRMFRAKEELIKISMLNNNIHLNENVLNISLLMQECDLAISANGTTVYELAAIGVPTISFAMVEEQLRSAETLASLGVISYCGKSYKNQKYVCEEILKKVTYYIDNIEDLILLSTKAKALIDGNGCQKIVDELLNN